MTRAHELRVFAVEPESVQLTWSHLEEGTVRIRVAGRTGDPETGHDVGRGPGALTVDGLAPGSSHRLEITGAGLDEPVHLDARTAEHPPGEELFRLATLSDLHIGNDSWDFGGRIREKPEPTELHPVRATRAALRDLRVWGAERLVLKGDLAHTAQPEEWRTLGALLADVGIPVDVLPGNHDVHLVEDSVDPTAGARLAGFELVHAPVAREVPGIRLVLFDSTVAGLHKGRVAGERQEGVLELLGEQTQPALVATHHNLQRAPVPWFWPPGIPGPESQRFLHAVAAAAPSTLITSGHTHRHRRHTHGPITYTEVGSPTDYPGTWAGYVVHEGGIRQVVRRTEDPAILRFSERVRRAAITMWGRWSPGTLDDRCFTHPWRIDRPVG